jgi:beta-alanine degradation protein BauB
MDLGLAGRSSSTPVPPRELRVETADILLDEGAWAVDHGALPEIGTESLMTNPQRAGSGRLAGEFVDADFQGWSDETKADFVDHAFNDIVGSTLLSENDKMRVWNIHLAPGQRLGAHRHRFGYFWSAITDGESIQHTENGTTRRVSYRAGDTRHFDFGPDEYLLHDLENVGTAPLIFITVEHKPQGLPAPTRPATD